MGCFLYAQKGVNQMAYDPYTYFSQNANKGKRSYEMGGSSPNATDVPYTTYQQPKPKTVAPKTAAPTAPLVTNDPMQSSTTPVTEPYVPLDPATTSAPSMTDQIGSMYDSLLTSQTAQINSTADTAANALAKALSDSLAAQDDARYALTSAYQEAKNRAAAQSDIAKYNRAQKAAAQGIEGSAAMTDDIYSNIGLQNALGGLDRSKSEEIAAIERAIANLKSDYRGDLTTLYNKRDQDILAAGGEADYAKTSALIEQMLRDTEAAEAQKAQARKDELSTISRYYGKEDEAIASLSGDNDPTNDWIIKYLEAMKADRLNAPKPVYSGGGGTTSNTSAESGIVQTMLSMGDDAAAYEYLIGLGLSEGKTDQLFAFYADQKAMPQQTTQTTSTTTPTQVPASISAVNSITTAVRKMTERGTSTDEIADYLSGLIERGSLSAQQARDIAKNILGITL
jgi:hypothetical protein